MSVHIHDFLACGKLILHENTHLTRALFKKNGLNMHNAIQRLKFSKLYRAKLNSRKEETSDEKKEPIVLAILKLIVLKCHFYWSTASYWRSTS